MLKAIKVSFDVVVGMKSKEIKKPHNELKLNELIKMSGHESYDTGTCTGTNVEQYFNGHKEQQ